MENTEPITYDWGNAHIYAQWQWHDDARIVADSKALAAIAQACSAAIENKFARAALMTADGEGYHLQVCREDAPFGSTAWDEQDLPYVGIEYAECVGATLHEQWTKQASEEIRRLQLERQSWWDSLKGIIAMSNDPASVKAAAAALRWPDAMVANVRAEAQAQEN